MILNKKKRSGYQSDRIDMEDLLVLRSFTLAEAKKCVSTVAVRHCLNVFVDTLLETRMGATSVQVVPSSHGRTQSVL